MAPMTSSDWFHCSVPRPDARFRLFCFPYAGGGINAFRSWTKHLTDDIELCSIQLPGRDVRFSEAPFTEMSELVDQLARGLAPRFDRPYAFFGHSMGAIVAFELVRHVRREGLGLPVHLFVSARRAPTIPDPEPHCHELPDGEFVTQLVRRFDGIPRIVLENDELMNLVLPTLRADFKLLETYRYVPGEQLSQPLTVFGGTQDRFTTRDDLLAWNEMTRGAFQLHMVPGGHFFLQESQADVLRIVSRHLRDE